MEGYLFLFNRTKEKICTGHQRSSVKEEKQKKTNRSIIVSKPLYQGNANLMRNPKENAKWKIKKTRNQDFASCFLSSSYRRSFSIAKKSSKGRGRQIYFRGGGCFIFVKVNVIVVALFYGRSGETNLNGHKSEVKVTMQALQKREIEVEGDREGERRI